MNPAHFLRTLVCGALLTAGIASSATAEGTFDIPAGAHFNPQKLGRVGDFLREQVASGKIPGAILLIQQHGKPVYHEFIGVQDVVSRQPMTDQTIFRLFSMTKAITSVAAMMLVDEGKLKLEDPVAKYIPYLCECEGRRREKERGRHQDAGAGAAEPAADHSRPDASHVWNHLWLLWRQPGPESLCGRKSLWGRFRLGRICRADCKAAAARPAGVALAIRPFHRRSRPDHGDRVWKIPARG